MATVAAAAATMLCDPLMLLADCIIAKTLTTTTSNAQFVAINFMVGDGLCSWTIRQHEMMLAVAGNGWPAEQQ